jgi:hypothetical protein
MPGCTSSNNVEGTSEGKPGPARATGPQGGLRLVGHYTQASSGFGFDYLRAPASSDLDPAGLRPFRHGNLYGENALIV